MQYMSVIELILIISVSWRLTVISISWEKTLKPAYDKTYNKTCATCEDSDLSLRWPHMPSAVSRPSKEGWNITLAILGWMYRLICVFAGHTGLIVGFVVPWLINKLSEYQLHSEAVISYHTSPKNLTSLFNYLKCWMSGKRCRSWSDATGQSVRILKR